MYHTPHLKIQPKKKSIMKISKKYRNILVGFSVIICYLSSCIPAMDCVYVEQFKNCTNDTLFVGISDYDNIDSIWFRYIYHVDIKSKAPLLASIDSILRNNNSNINMTTYDNGHEIVITPTEQARMEREYMTIYPDSIFPVNELYLFNNTDTEYFFLIKFKDAKIYSWDEIREKKLYNKWITIKDKDGKFDRNIKYQ